MDGEHFEVRDAEHAAEILDALQEVVAETITKAQSPPKAVVVAPPDTFAQDLQAQVDATNAILARMYAEAIQEESELEELMSMGVL